MFFRSAITWILFFLPFSLYAQNLKPNIVFIYVDDLGYGDLGCYGATKIKTPNLDRLATNGIRFTNGHSTSATCTPSRYALMTGEFPWRKKGTGILPGDAALIIPPGKTTLPSLFQKAGYKTGIVGKWHLGLGTSLEKNWNGELKPGPNEVGFDYSFIFPATADRVPTVFVENHHVVALDSSDPIQVNYQQKVGNDPTGKEHPELLKMKSSPDHGHNNTIVNGIGRIGFMSGGNKARWTDEEMPLTFLEKAKEFMDENQPFFLYYALTEPHVPRMPSTMFKGKSGLGYRGDAILQLDWTVGEIVKELEQLGISNNTIIIFTSDNGPVLDDGYEDEAVTKANGHKPAGLLRGGKYSAFEGGTRVPFIISWPGTIKPQVSDALVCQIDIIHSFSSFLKQPLSLQEAPDSYNLINTLLGKSPSGRDVLVLQGGALSIIRNDWKYIEPSNGTPYNNLTDIETGNHSLPQLYDLKNDIGEKNNLAEAYPQKVKELSALLQKIKANG
ncbi:arylsulfatase [Flavihumibacter sp. ZG627]|uniref:sulfatase family protein n=1 Tax=Flavihumibacter sp. ZG627 TaxID=1463156 RepID=UPI00057CD1AD|nr:arylsulfatase [Flavihumibacter sp. ZG627]KIC89914.1 arylsulfatase [Flavihumibacter sp. ZG627]